MKTDGTNATQVATTQKTGTLGDWMNGNKAASLGLGLSNYIDEKNLKLTPKQAAAMLYNELEKYQKLTNTGVTNTINRLHGDISKGNTTTEIYLKNGIQPFSYEFKVFSKEEQEKRKAFQEEYLRKHCEVFGQTQYDQGNFVNKHQILKKSGVNSFGNGIITAGWKKAVSHKLYAISKNQRLKAKTLKKQ